VDDKRICDDIGDRPRLSDTSGKDDRDGNRSASYIDRTRTKKQHHHYNGLIRPSGKPIQILLIFFYLFKEFRNSNLEQKMFDTNNLCVLALSRDLMSRG
jgi:hypothetical protein